MKKNLSRFRAEEFRDQMLLVSSGSGFLEEHEGHKANLHTDDARAVAE